MMDEDKAGQDERAREILRVNDRGGYTVPTARLYPFQWNWDSALVAMGWAMFDEARGWREIEMLLAGQWEDGFVPHIVFHAPSEDYFPGPEVWGLAERAPPTSGITQPPVLATAVRWMLERARARAEAEARAAAIYPRLVASHRWWVRARDPHASGLVTTLHPWETGMDNSPAWDEALARVPRETTTPIVRRDIAHVAAAMRPRAEEYERFIHLVDLFRGLGWSPEKMLAESPFKVVDIGTNAILLRAERDLLVLARRFGSVAERAEIEARIARQGAAIGRLWSGAGGIYFSADLIANALIPVSTSAGMLPVFASEYGHAAALAARLRAWAEAVRWLVPSIAPDSPSFEPQRYWRGPVWPCMNWMLADGFGAAGETATARLLAEAMGALIRASGFYEYFDPCDGAGLGGTDFSWTAAVALLLPREGEGDPRF